MKNTIKLFGIIALVAIIGFSMAACDDGGGSGPGPGGGNNTTTYAVTVNGGSGSGSYAAGATVSISATVPSGKTFTNWTVNSGGATLANANSASTTFTMPANAVTVTANFTENIGPGIEFTDSRGNKITIPGGAASCAIRVISFTHGTPWTSDPKAMDPLKILGAPDYKSSTDENSVTLGAGGVIVLEFGVYITDGPGMDIYVFEVGPQVEATKVEISNDSQNWIYVGDCRGSISGVDINGKVSGSGAYKYIRLTDLDKTSSSYPGADIDAVAIIHPVR